MAFFKNHKTLFPILFRMLFRLETCSRPAMAVCLNDGSVDTFWESGDEDKNRPKIIVVNVQSEQLSNEPMIMGVYIDNHRDQSYRTTNIQFSAILPQKAQRKRLISEIIDHQFVGWVL